MENARSKRERDERVKVMARRPEVRANDGLMCLHMLIIWERRIILLRMVEGMRFGRGWHILFF